VRLFAFNDLGMHCYDADYSVFAILPLFNVLHAQAIRVRPRPKLLGPANLKLSYKAQKDPTGSINTTSIGKTNFWDFVRPIFGLSPPADVGLLGAKMPGSGNAPRPFRQGFDRARRWFSAAGIPITGLDDAGNKNPYSLMRVRATDKATGRIVSSLPTVVPASDEMTCGTCHLTGGEAAGWPFDQWSQDPNPVRQFKINILLLHDIINQTDLAKRQPVLCFECHYSLALDLQGNGPNDLQKPHKFLSHAMHGHHADFIQTDLATSAACYNCHPGNVTQCLRGTMGNSGIVCSDCHGDMFAVASIGRAAPWADEPKCQSCHTGDALRHLGDSIRLTRTYDDDPSIATFRLAKNKRFAENRNTLFRNSVGHGGVACESCHGSPHAEWPSREENDNLAAVALQGHPGPIIECAVCHGTRLQPTTWGPHGLHNVNNPKWYNGGHSLFANKSCQACHGTGAPKTLQGTVLSRAAADRQFTLTGRTVAVSAGQEIGCVLCHAGLGG
jgi:hypothetical protein